MTSDKNRLTGVVIMDVAKARDTEWAKNLYKPSILNLQIYVVTIKHMKDFSNGLPLSHIDSSYNAGWNYHLFPSAYI